MYILGDCRSPTLMDLLVSLLRQYYFHFPVVLLLYLLACRIEYYGCLVVDRIKSMAWISYMCLIWFRGMNYKQYKLVQFRIFMSVYLHSNKPIFDCIIFPNGIFCFFVDGICIIAYLILCFNVTVVTVWWVAVLSWVYFLVTDLTRWWFVISIWFVRCWCKKEKNTSDNRLQL